MTGLRPWMEAFLDWVQVLARMGRMWWTLLGFQHLNQVVGRAIQGKNGMVYAAYSPHDLFGVCRKMEVPPCYKEDAENHRYAGGRNCPSKGRTQPSIRRKSIPRPRFDRSREYTDMKHICKSCVITPMKVDTEVLFSEIFERRPIPLSG